MIALWREWGKEKIWDDQKGATEYTASKSEALTMIQADEEDEWQKSSRLNASKLF